MASVVTDEFTLHHIVIPGPPMWKERPRFDPRSGKPYTPKETRDAEEIVRMYARARIRKPLEGPVRVTLWVRVGPMRAKPDIDNFAKLVLDACNTIAWKDDRQVVELHVYLERDAATPGTEIQIQRVVEDPNP